MDPGWKLTFRILLTIEFELFHRLSTALFRGVTVIISLIGSILLLDTELIVLFILMKQVIVDKDLLNIHLIHMAKYN